MAALYTMQWFPWDDEPQHTADWRTLHDVTAADSFTADYNTKRTVKKHYQAIAPALKMVMNAPESLSFTVPATHVDYSKLKSAGIRMCVAVFRNGAFLWGGHPLSIDEDLYGNLAYSCESALGWLSDVAAPTFSGERTIDGWFYYFVMLFYRYGAAGAATASVIDKAVCYRRFSAYQTWGTINWDGKEAANSSNTVSRYTGKNLTVMELLDERLLDYFGGYFEIGLTAEHEDWFDDPDEAKGRWTSEYKNGQGETAIALEVGENIQSLTRTTDYTDFCTALVPVDENGNSILADYTDHGAVSNWEAVESFSDWAPYGVNLTKYANSPMIIHADLAEDYGIIAQTYEVTASGHTEEEVEKPEKEVFDSEEAWQEAYDVWVGSRLDIVYQIVSQLAAPESTIEVKAIDPTLLTEADLHIGSKVTYTDRENNEYAEMRVEELELDLDDPSSNTITLNGTLKTLSRKVKGK